MGNNRYFSQERRVIASNLTSPQISPPADLVIPAGSIVPRAFIINHNNINQNSNLILRRLGIYCNFADGLVFSDVHEHQSFALKAYAYGPPAANEVGTLSIVAGSTTVAGVGTAFTSLNAGDVFMLDGITSFPFRIGTINNDTQLLLKEDPIAAFAAYNYGICPQLGTTETFEFGTEMNSLNEMYPFDEVVRISDIVPYGSTIQFIVLEIVWADVGNDWTFLTKAVSTDFVGDQCYFNAHADIQVTGP